MYAFQLSFLTQVGTTYAETDYLLFDVTWKFRGMPMADGMPVYLVYSISTSTLNRPVQVKGPQSDGFAQPGLGESKANRALSSVFLNSMRLKFAIGW